jgi:hypothetical protein
MGFRDCGSATFLSHGYMGSSHGRRKRRGGFEMEGQIWQGVRRRILMCMFMIGVKGSREVR